MLERIRESGRLRVLTLNSPTTYYYDTEGYAGFDHDLVNMFTEHIGVTPEFIVASSFKEIVPRVASNEAHIGAAGIGITESWRHLVRFGPPLQTIKQQVVYRRGTRRPRGPEDLVGRELEVVAGRSYVEHLQQLRKDYPAITWQETDALSGDELLDLVHEGMLDLTIAGSHRLALSRRLNTELVSGFGIGEPQPLAWIFAHSADSSLYDAARSFLEEISENGALEALLDRYYGHVQRFDYVDTRAFRRHVDRLLWRYRPWFEEAAEQHDLDWRLLAAMSYQESHWNPGAVSPTGVRGIMMLTRTTAKEVGIADRKDPQQSIHGGARYIAALRRRIPPNVTEPDRTWFALAAYNVGIGHLYDARGITEKRNGNPDRWVDVKQSLPLLSQKRWYAQTYYGFARGKEPVQYVENVRKYHDLLASWLDPMPPPDPRSPALLISAPAL